MSGYLFLLPLSLVLGLIGLATFLWTLKKNQYEDLDGASYRILDTDDFPLPTDSVTSDKKITNDSEISTD